MAKNRPQSQGAATPVFDPQKIIGALNRHRVDYITL
jgi:hypothetical protein